MELVDMRDSKSRECKLVWVRLPPAAPQREQEEFLIRALKNVEQATNTGEAIQKRQILLNPSITPPNTSYPPPSKDHLLSILHT